MKSIQHPRCMLIQSVPQLPVRCDLSRRSIFFWQKNISTEKSNRSQRPMFYSWRLFCGLFYCSCCCFQKACPCQSVHSSSPSAEVVIGGQSGGPRGAGPLWAAGLPARHPQQTRAPDSLLRQSVTQHPHCGESGCCSYRITADKALVLEKLWLHLLDKPNMFN